MFVGVTNMKLFSANNTAKLFMYAALFFGLWVFITSVIFGEQELDINMHDTYYVIGNNTISLLFFVLNIILAVVYWFVKPKINLLNFIHITSSFLLPFIFNGVFLKLIIGENFEFILSVVNTIGIIYLVATLLFLINVTYTLITYLIKPK